MLFLKTAATSPSTVSSPGHSHLEDREDSFRLTLDHISFFCQKANTFSEIPLQVTSLLKVGDETTFLHCKETQSYLQLTQITHLLTQTKLEFQKQDGNNGFQHSH